MNASFKSAEIEITTEEAILTETRDDGLCNIQSAVRRDWRVSAGEAYGNLLKALCETAGCPEINVTFTGSDPDDPTTKFHLEKSDDKEANTLRYRSAGGDNYYLAVENAGQVKLCKLDDSPSEDKYFFKMKTVGHDIETFHTFQSLKTKGYLRCGNDGVVFVKMAKIAADGVPEVPEDRQTWFRYLPSHKIRERVFQHTEEHILQVVNENCIACETVKIKETIEDTEDSAKGTAMEPEQGTTEELDARNIKDPGEGTCSEQGKRKSDDPQEMISENLTKGDSKYPEKGNSNDTGVDRSVDQGKVTPEDLKVGNCGISGTEKSEDAAKGNSPHVDAGTSD